MSRIEKMELKENLVKATFLIVVGAVILAILFLIVDFQTRRNEHKSEHANVISYGNRNGYEYSKTYKIDEDGNYILIAETNPH